MKKPLFFRPRELADKSVAYDIIRWHYEDGKTRPIILGSLNPAKNADGKLPEEVTAKLTDDERAETSAFWSANLEAIRAEREARTLRASPDTVAWAVGDALKAIEMGLPTTEQLATLSDRAAALAKAVRKAQRAAKAITPTVTQTDEQPELTQVSGGDLFVSA